MIRLGTQGVALLSCHFVDPLESELAANLGKPQRSFSFEAEATVPEKTKAHGASVNAPHG